jgi:transient receptor potential cation channel subfamily M member 3
MKRHKMAMFVCKRGEETLAKSLFSTKINKALAREAELDDLDSEIADDFKKNAEEFSNLAYGLLDKCYKEDDELTQQLLTYDLVNWSHWTCLSLAVCSNLKEFLSHAACQMLINDLWMGGMKIRKNIILKVVAGLLFFPAIFMIPFKSAKELQYMPQTQEEHENELENKEDDNISNVSNDDQEAEKLDKISMNSLKRNRTENVVSKSNLFFYLFYYWVIMTRKI